MSKTGLLGLRLSFARWLCSKRGRDIVAIEYQGVTFHFTIQVAVDIGDCAALRARDLHERHPSSAPKQPSAHLPHVYRVFHRTNCVGRVLPHCGSGYR